MQTIKVFKNKAEFDKRVDKTVNGYSQEFVDENGITDVNIKNCTGCWNCEDCSYCVNCESCSDCNDCKYCISCCYCDRCIDCEYCDSCDGFENGFNF